MNRVAVMGPPGSGKSTVARRIGQILGLPVFHLDTLFWKPGWVESDPNVFDARVRELSGEVRWVIDGNYGRTQAERVRTADLVVFLDLPKPLYLMRIVKRRIRYAGRPRPDMTDGCIERLDREFWTFASQWSRRSRTRLLEILATETSQDRVVRLRSRAAVTGFLADLATRA